jgi:hypothetical protein
MGFRSARAALAAVLAGGSLDWQDLGITAGELLAACNAEEVGPLVYYRLREQGVAHQWPNHIVRTLADCARDAAAEELLRGAQTREVADALARAGIRALLIKGTPLAYSVYPMPALRPRSDTDLLIAADDVEAARAVFASLGFTPTTSCDRLFSQFEVRNCDRLGLTHAFDVHWKISTQAVFADALTYEELRARAVPLPALGPAAMTLSPTDALFLACMHPVMHHHNEERLLWIYDIHLIAGRLTARELDEYARIARTRKMAAVCARGLRLAQTTFNTPLPPGFIAGLKIPDAAEPSAEYLASERRWHDETIASLRALPRFGDRMRMMRDVLLPSRAYMLAAYGLYGKPLASWLLPALYVHRNVRGAWKIFAGKK